MNTEDIKVRALLSISLVSNEIKIADIIMIYKKQMESLELVDIIRNKVEWMDNIIESEESRIMRILETKLNLNVEKYTDPKKSGKTNTIILNTFREEYSSILHEISIFKNQNKKLNNIYSRQKKDCFMECFYPALMIDKMFLSKTIIYIENKDDMLKLVTIEVVKRTTEYLKVLCVVVKNK